MHRLRQQKAGACNKVEQATPLPDNSTFRPLKATVVSLPMSTRASPVEHLVHGRHSVTAHWRDVAAGHNGVIHPRMYCQLLLDAEEHCQH